MFLIELKFLSNNPITSHYPFGDPIILVRQSTSDKLDNTTEHIPHNKVGLLLGTEKYLTNGSINLYYTYRINAVVDLYKSGHIEYILVSGDNSNKNYDEPSTIKEDLIAEGIPTDMIYLDYAGFRTLDSIKWCVMFTVAFIVYW